MTSSVPDRSVLFSFILKERRAGEEYSSARLHRSNNLTRTPITTVSTTTRLLPGQHSVVAAALCTVVGERGARLGIAGLSTDCYCTLPGTGIRGYRVGGPVGRAGGRVAMGNLKHSPDPVADNGGGHSEGKGLEGEESLSSRDWELVGFKNFKRTNPLTDRFSVDSFHHIEFWCGDASNTWRRFSWGLGMTPIAKSDQTTGNQTYCSYVLRSHELVFAFTAPYSKQIDQSNSQSPHPGFNSDAAKSFFQKHGLGVRAVGILVDDAQTAFEIAVKNGAVGNLEPVELSEDTKSAGGGMVKIAELKLYGDVVLRLVSNHRYTGPFLPRYEAVKSPPLCYGIRRLDHAVGNVANLAEAAKYVGTFTGFHEFAEFVADDVGTSESGLNSLVLASNNEMVLLPLNEPVYGTKRKSQIQTYLEHNEGPGLQHLALFCDDIFSCLKEMRMRTELGGFDFMPKPPPTYYKNLPARVAGILTEEQCKECDRLGILVDKDDQGVLLQIFTKPLGDRPTIFIEIIQRIGCMYKSTDGSIVQKGGCGGFGKGNFSELFKSIEEYEKTLDGVKA